jgi:hypothetical protein
VDYINVVWGPAGPPARYSVEGTAASTLPMTYSTEGEGSFLINANLFCGSEELDQWMVMPSLQARVAVAHACDRERVTGTVVGGG